MPTTTNSAGCCSLALRVRYRAPALRMKRRPLALRVCLPPQVREYVTDNGVVVTDSGEPVWTLVNA